MTEFILNVLNRTYNCLTKKYPIEQPKKTILKVSKDALKLLVSASVIGYMSFYHNPHYSQAVSLCGFSAVFYKVSLPFTEPIISFIKKDSRELSEVEQATYKMVFSSVFSAIFTNVMIRTSFDPFDAFVITTTSAFCLSLFQETAKKASQVGCRAVKHIKQSKSYLVTCGVIQKKIPALFMQLTAA